jgi:hypothetical protein
MGDSHGEAKHMSYIWEVDIDVFSSPSGHGTLATSWHLKKVWDKDPLEGRTPSPYDSPLRGQWKVSVAWISKIGDRKYSLRFASHHNDKTFRSLKAAKAYAVAIITLEDT